MDKTEIDTAMFAHTARYAALMERRNSITAMMEAELAQLIPDDLRTRIDGTKNVYNSALQAIDEDLSKSTESIKELAGVLYAGCKINGVEVIYRKAAALWDTKALDQMAVEHPEILEAKRQGKASVVVKWKGE